MIYTLKKKKRKEGNTLLNTEENLQNDSLVWRLESFHADWKTEVYRIYISNVFLTAVLLMYNLLLLLFSCSVVLGSLRPWTAACQASLYFTISWTLLRLKSLELVMTSNHHILCCPLLFLPSVFPSLFQGVSSSLSGGPSTGVSASTLVLPVKIQGWFPLGLTGLISLLSMGLSRVFSSTTVWRHQFFSALPLLLSCSHISIWLLEKTQL